MSLQQALNKILPFVRKPQRYLGNEINMIRKPKGSVLARMALAYPDLYEIAASNTGLSVLYRVINSDPRFAVERACAPDVDMRAALRNEGIPLYSFESFSPLSEFDLLGFTLQSELTYPDIADMLSLAQIPVLRTDRSNEHPLIVVGGPLSTNPMPLSGIVDLVVIGDGEEVVLSLLSICAETIDREERLKRMAKVRGVFAPKYPPADFHPAKIPELRMEHLPIRTLIPLMEPVHCRYSVEVQRGCTHGCRFCSAGYYYRPVREREPQDVYRAVHEAVTSGGWRDVSFLSLSTADYTGLSALLEGCRGFATEDRVQLSLPSTRLDKVTAELFRKLKLSRRSGITFAPEAGSERLRRVINKPWTNAEILDNISLALDHGYDVIKLYFMSGLPTETDEDIKALIELVNEVAYRFKAYKGRRSLHVSLSPFCPKPGTPFEREALLSSDEIVRRALMVKNGLKHKNIEFKWGDGRMSVIETMLARGGAELSSVLKKAAEQGLVLQSWMEHFKPEAWPKLLAECGLDIEDYTQAIPAERVVPWDCARSKATRAFLADEWSKALKGEPTPDCREGCSDECGSCSGSVHNRISEQKAVIPEPRTSPGVLPITDGQLAFHYRIEYEKGPLVRFVAHRDLMRLFEQATLCAHLPVRFSQGFSPRPLLSFSYPLPLGMTGVRELMALDMDQSIDPLELLKLNPFLPEGLRVLSATRMENRASLERFIIASVYRIEISGHESWFDADRFLAFMNSPAWMAEVEQKSGLKKIDARALVHSAVTREGALCVTLTQTPTANLRVLDFLNIVFGISHDQALLLSIARTEFVLQNP